MPTFRTDSIQNGLVERLGESLRGVVCYDSGAYDYWLRADVDSLYSEDEIRAFVDDSIVDQLSEEEEAGLFYLGDLEATIRVFEESWVVRVSTESGGKRGCLFSVEREPAGLEALEDCLDIVQDRAGQ